METTIVWSSIAVNILTMATLVGGMLGVFWRFVNKQTRAIVMSNAVPQDSYREDQAAMWREINQIKKFDAEFAVIKTQVAHVQQDTTEIKNAVAGLSAEITGAVQRVAEMKGEIKGRLDR